MSFVEQSIIFSGSLFNHDCNPNCIQIFDGQKLKVVTLRDVRQEEEVC